jgi:CRP-like cAMP-binding protein
MAFQDKKFWHLHNHKLFAQLQDEEVDQLCIISRFKEANKGEMIFFTGTASSQIFILKIGVVKIIETTAEGEEIVKDILHAGDLFGQLPGSNENSSNEYAVAASEVVSFCTFKKEDFESVLSRNPVVSLKFAVHIGDKMRVLEQKYNSLIFKDTRTRLLEFLKRYVQEFNVSHHTPERAPNHLKQEDIAQLIGASRQTVASLLNELERDGIIVYNRKEIKLDLKYFQKK